MTELREIPRPRFTEDDVNRAHDAWGANCGPVALAAVLGKTLDEVRDAVPLFYQRRYTNPSMMFEALRCLRVSYRLRPDKDWPAFGLARVQWEGPWTQPGVPKRVRYRYTHWVGACARNRQDIGIFDINCINNGSGWVALDVWVGTVVPYLLEHAVPRANGKWHLTHALEIQL